MQRRQWEERLYHFLGKYPLKDFVYVKIYKKMIYLAVCYHLMSFVQLCFYIFFFLLAATG